jgi:hypothetical protein
MAAAERSIGPRMCAGRPMKAADGPSRRAWRGSGSGGGITGRRRNPAIAPAPPRRPGGRQASVGRAPEGRSHTPYHHGVWDRPSVTLSDSENRGAAGQGKSEQGRDRSPSQSSRELKLEFGMEEARERKAGGGKSSRPSVSFGAWVTGSEGGVGKREELSAEVLPESDAGARVEGSETGTGERFILTGRTANVIQTASRCLPRPSPPKSTPSRAPRR